MARLRKTNKAQHKPKHKKENKTLNNIIWFLLIVVDVIFICLVVAQYNTKTKKVDNEIHISHKQKNNKINLEKKIDFNDSEKGSNKDSMRTPINWKQSSETIPYPTITKNFWIDVNIPKQRVYLMQGDNKVYTMYCSTGTQKEPTPTGLYHVEKEKGESFYNQKTGMGANYWTSFKEHGVYLFHTVPTDENGNYIVSEADKLGQQTGSHGCVRLSIPDAKFIYEQVPTGTPVYIHDNNITPKYSKIKQND